MQLMGVLYIKHLHPRPRSWKYHLFIHFPDLPSISSAHRFGFVKQLEGSISSIYPLVFGLTTSMKYCVLVMKFQRSLVSGVRL